MRNDLTRLWDTASVCVTGTCPRWLGNIAAFVLVEVDDGEGKEEGKREEETYFYECKKREDA